MVAVAVNSTAVLTGEWLSESVSSKVTGVIDGVALCSTTVEIVVTLSSGVTAGVVPGLGAV